jgi:hypothetical protein
MNAGWLGGAQVVGWSGSGGKAVIVTGWVGNDQPTRGCARLARLARGARLARLALDGEDPSASALRAPRPCDATTRNWRAARP